MINKEEIGRFAFIPVMIIYIIVFLVFSYGVEKQPFEAYSAYSQGVITTIGIIFGILGIITLYYLGKYHDYSKEVIKIKGNYYENFKKLSFLIESKKSETNKELTDSESQKIINTLFNEQQQLSQDIPKQILVESMWVSFLVTWTALGYFLNINTPTQNQFIITIAGLITGIAFLIHGWFLHEYMLKRLINILGQSYTILGDVKVRVYKLEKTNE